MSIDITAVNRTQVAKATGTNLAHISRIFARKSKPSLPLAIKIARHLQIPLEDLCIALGLDQSDLPGPKTLQKSLPAPANSQLV